VVSACLAEVDKMTTFYPPPPLRPIPLPLTQQVDDLAFLLKKGRVERWMVSTFDLWKEWCRRLDLWKWSWSLKMINLSPWDMGCRRRSHLGQICDILTPALGREGPGEGNFITLFYNFCVPPLSPPPPKDRWSKVEQIDLQPMQRSLHLCTYARPLILVFWKSSTFYSFRPKVGYLIDVEHSTDLQVSMPTSAF
jgi:hypothetical protein